MATVLLTSEKFVKSFTNIDDNMSAAYLLPAVRESQDVELTIYLGNALVSRLKGLVQSGEIKQEGFEIYREILEKAQYFLAYSAIAKVIPIAGVKITNFGITQAQDENIRTLGVEDIPTVIGWYTKKADSYARELLRFVLSNKGSIPELDECACGQMKAHLNSSASSGLFLGGARGRRLK